MKVLCWCIFVEYLQIGLMIQATVSVAVMLSFK